MAEHSAKAFTADKLKKFAASGSANIGQRDRDSGALADDYGRSAAKSSDCSAFAEGGAAKAPSLGRAARAAGGRVSRANGGKTRDITKVSDAGVHRYPDEVLVRKGGGRVDRARGGRTKGKGKTVVNVIIGGDKGQQPPAPPPMAAPGPVPPPPPPPPPKPPMMPPPGAGGGGMPPMAPPGGAPMGPAGAPPGGPIPPGLIPGRASGGRIAQKYGAGSGLGRIANAKRENHGKVELSE